MIVLKYVRYFILLVLLNKRAVGAWLRSVWLLGRSYLAVVIVDRRTALVGINQELCNWPAK